MLKYLVLGASFGVAGALQPGPLQAFIISQSVKNGWKRTLPVAMVPLVSDGPVILVTLLVLSSVPHWFAQWIRIAGGLVAAYMAFGILRSAFAAPKILKPALAAEAARTFGKAALVNFLNPNAWIGWSLMLGPLLLQAWGEHPTHGIAMLAGFYGVMVPGLAVAITFFGVAGQSGPRASKALIVFSGLAMAGFAAYLLWSGISGGA